jgi:hypothetical protein
MALLHVNDSPPTNSLCVGVQSLGHGGRINKANLLPGQLRREGVRKR